MQFTFTLLSEIVTRSYNSQQFKCLFYNNLIFSKKEFRSVAFLFLCMIVSLAGNAQNGSARVSLIPEPFSIAMQPSNSTVCSGNATTFSVGLPSGGGAYDVQWQVDKGSGVFINITDIAPYSGTTTKDLTVTAATAEMSGYKYQVYVARNGMDDISDPATLTVNSTGQWLGTANSDWNNTANWTCGTIPTETTNVVIGEASNMPEINANAACKDLTINANATLSVLDGEFSIKGAITNNGTFTAKTPIIFSGDAQVIPAGEYSEIQIQGTGTKTLAGNVKIQGLLLLFSSYLPRQLRSVHRNRW